MLTSGNISGNTFNLLQYSSFEGFNGILQLVTTLYSDVDGDDGTYIGY